MGTEVPNGNENDMLEALVTSDEYGEGLPYAPENWPNPGDIWGWRVGKRVSLHGNYVDRYLYLPKRLRTSDPTSRRKSFASKLSVTRYMEAKFPDVDINVFFASFTWKIPAKRGAIANGRVKRSSKIALPTDDQTDQSLFDADLGGCKAGNKTCTSLTEQLENSTIIDCNICCTEPRFCRECCCILCCKSVDSAHGGYSYVKCKAIVVGEGRRLCAHISHVNCAIRSYMAGKVGGSIGLDAEYYCRRCDAKSDLVPHVDRMLRSCESVDSRDDLKKILKLGLAILRGTERIDALGLLNRVELAYSKVKKRVFVWESKISSHLRYEDFGVFHQLDGGTSLEDIWKVDENSFSLSIDITQHGNTTMEIDTNQNPLDIQTYSPSMSGHFDWLSESLKLEEEIDQVLQSLRKSQEIEYKLAEDRLYDQKSYISSLYQQLEVERSELTSNTSPTDHDDLLGVVLNRVDDIKQELAKLKDMEKVASGFGKTSRSVLEEHFDLEIER